MRLTGHTCRPHVPDRLLLFFREPLAHFDTSCSTNSLFANQLTCRDDRLRPRHTGDRRCEKRSVGQVSIQLRAPHLGSILHIHRHVARNPETIT